MGDQRAFAAVGRRMRMPGGPSAPTPLTTPAELLRRVQRALTERRDAEARG
ncbi:MAG TPA: hypothetical protein VF636_08235 [Sphingomonas sp.]|jgi:hypothetical protein